MNTTEGTYTQRELIEFGQYLLSLKREKSLKASNKNIPYSEKKRFVYDADLANFKDE